MDDLTVLARFVHFVALSLLFGRSLYRLSIRPAQADDARVSHLIDVVALAAAAASAAGWSIFVFQEMAGGWAEMFDADTAVALLTDTRFGRISVLRFALMAAVAVLMLVRRERSRRQELALLTLAGVLAASLVGFGHGLRGEGAMQPIHVVSDMAHILCAATWIGSLVSLWIVLRHAVTGNDAASVAAVPVLLPRFSRVGYWAVATLLVTGCFNANLLLARRGASLARLDDLIGTDYGHILVVKLGLVAGMVAIAIANRLLFTPRILAAASSGSITPLYHSVTLEQIVGAIVLATTALLGTVHPVV